MKLSRQTKIWAGTVIVLALILQVVTYVKYNQLESQVAGFHESLAVAQDETEAAAAYDIFYDQTTPLLKAQEADAGCGWSVIIGKCWAWGRGGSGNTGSGRPRRVTPDPNSGLGTPNPTGPGASGGGGGGLNSELQGCLDAGYRYIDCAQLNRQN